MSTTVKNPARRAHSWSGYTNCSSCGEQFTVFGISRHWDHCKVKAAKAALSEQENMDKRVAARAKLETFK